MFKTTVILFNIGLLLFSLISFIRALPLKSIDITDIVAILLLFGTPIINLIVIFFNEKDNSWFKLFFKRKALEEQQKIKELEEKIRR